VDHALGLYGSPCDSSRLEEQFVGILSTWSVSGLPTVRRSDHRCQRVLGNYEAAVVRRNDKIISSAEPFLKEALLANTFSA